MRQSTRTDRNQAAPARIAVALLAPLLVLAAGCAGSEPDSGSAGQPPGSVSDSFDQRAGEVVEAWQRILAGTQWRDGFIPLQDLTVIPAGDRSDSLTQALRLGWFRSAVKLSDSAPQDASVTFPDGDQLSVPLLSAEAAYQAMDLGDAACPREGTGGTGGADPTVAPDQGGVTAAAPGAVAQGTPGSSPANDPGQATSTQAADQCTVLTVTAAKLGTVALLTNRGMATVPAWQFTVEQWDAPVSRVAVAPQAVGARPEISLATPPAATGAQHLVAAQDLTEVDGARLTYRLGVGACDQDIAPLVHETRELVVVGGQVTNGGGICNDMLKLQPVSVTLSEPLGARAVIDVLNGTVLHLGNTW